MRVRGRVKRDLPCGSNDADVSKCSMGGGGRGC